MKNDYQYIDHDFIYTDPDTGVLRNLGEIADHDALLFAEAAATTKRAGELKAKPIRIVDSSALFSIHPIFGTLKFFAYELSDCAKF